MVFFKLFKTIWLSTKYQYKNIHENVWRFIIFINYLGNRNCLKWSTEDCGVKETDFPVVNA